MAVKGSSKRAQLYRHFGHSGELLYVGVSLHAAARLAEHQRSPWFDRIASVTITNFHSREAAERAERQAIRNERPLFNRVHNRGEPAAHLTPRKRIAERLRRERERLGLTQIDLAKAARITYRQQWKLEAGLAPVSAEYLSNVARAGADVRFIVCGNTTRRA